MTRIISIIIIAAAAMLSMSPASYAQDETIDHPRVKEEVVEIETNSQCNMCKKRIEKELFRTEGIMKAELDVKSSMLTVNYDAHKTDADIIREAVSKIGYNADDVKADPKAQAALPKCCQPGGHK